MTKCFPRLVFSQHTWIMALTTVPWCQWTKRSSNPFTTLQFFAGGCWEDSYPALKRSCIQDLAWMPRALLLYTSKFYDFLTVIPVWATVIITGFYCLFYLINLLLCCLWVGFQENALNDFGLQIHFPFREQPPSELTFQVFILWYNFSITRKIS